jgi:DNA-binding response OmpR family regulator
MQNAPHILVVDDDLEIRKLLGRYLTEQELRVTLASTSPQKREYCFGGFTLNQGLRQVLMEKDIR